MGELTIVLAVSLAGAVCAGYEAKNKRPISAAFCAWLSALGLAFAGLILGLPNE